MRRTFTYPSLRILTFILAAGCTPGSGDTTATGSTGSTGSTGAESGGELTGGATGSTSDTPTTTEDPGTSSTGDASATSDDTLGSTSVDTTTSDDTTTSEDTTTSDDTTTTTDPVEEFCEGLEFPPEAPAMVADARWTGEMSIRLTDVEDFLCSGESFGTFADGCNSGFLLDIGFTAPIGPGEYVEGDAVTTSGGSAVWDRDCANGGFGEFSIEGTVTIYAATETCIVGAVLGKEMGDVRFRAPKCP